MVFDIEKYYVAKVVKTEKIALSSKMKKGVQISAGRQQAKKEVKTAKPKAKKGLIEIGKNTHLITLQIILIYKSVTNTTLNIYIL